jgi:hypothetical protein
MRRHVVASVAAGLCLAATLRAQEVSLRLGGLHACYSDSIAGDAGALGARLAWRGARARGLVEASWAQFTTGDAAGQAWGDFSLVGPSSARAAAGLRVSGIANSSRGGPWSGTGSAEVFGVVVVRGWTLAASLGGGGVRSFAAESRPLAVATARARVDLTARTTLYASLAATVAGGVRYADATLSADWRRGRYSAGGLVGARTGDLVYRPWAQAWASWAFAPAMALEGAAGTYPRDLTGFDHGVYVNLGVRVNLLSGEDERDDTGSAAVTRGIARRSAAAADVLVEPIDSATSRVTFVVPNATHIAITGDWNEWTPEQLEFNGGDRWIAVVRAGPGAHRFALLVDGRSVVPAGVARMPDDFGGEVGLMMLQR